MKFRPVAWLRSVFGGGESDSARITLLDLWDLARDLVMIRPESRRPKGGGTA